MNRGANFFLQPKAALVIAVLAAALAALILTLPRSSSRSPEAAPQEEPASSALPWQALALLKTGENPLWFELGEGGPRLIPSPEEASLTPFVPWPLSRRIAGMLPWEGSLALAVNRDGFFVISPRAEPGARGSALLYRSAGHGWDPYTIASFFIYDSSPAALLYRDGFFSDPEAPLLAHQVMILKKDSPFPVAASVPALDQDAFLPGRGWEANALKRGPDGFWYYRLSQTAVERPGTVYFRSADLSLSGEKVSVTDFRNSSFPEEIAKAPPFAASFLGALALRSDSFGRAGALMISPAFPGTRFFSIYSAPPPEDGGYLILSAYSREDDPLGLACFPNGRGMASFDGIGLVSFSLPALPESFAYTGVGLAGDVLVASWEEQEDSGVGAAGFMAVELHGIIPDVSG
jgi:hypothetical protein